MDKSEKSSAANESRLLELPVLPLRDVVVYPHMVIPLFVGREKSIRALDVAMEGDKQILLVAQRSPDVDDPRETDLHSVGTLASLLQLLKLPDGTIKVLVEGAARAEIRGYRDRDGVLVGSVKPLEPGYSRSEREIEVVDRAAEQEVPDRAANQPDRLIDRLGDDLQQWSERLERLERDEHDRSRIVLARHGHGRVTGWRRRASRRNNR